MKDIRIPKEAIEELESVIEFYLDEAKGDCRIEDNIFNLKETENIDNILEYAEMYYKMSGKAQGIAFVLDLLGIEVKGLDALKDAFYL